MTGSHRSRRVARSTSLWLAVALVCLIALPAAAQPAHNARFSHLSVEHGLSHEAVLAVLQDSDGLLWFGTQDGLNRYNGYEFTTFTHDPKDPTSIANGWIWSLLEDSRGNIWVGTDGGGLNRFLPKRGAFERFVSNPSDLFSLSHNSIRTIFEDDAGMLWIGTDGGLNRLDPDTRRFTRFAHDPSNPTSLSNDRVRTIAQDPQGGLWVGTDGGGLSKFDPDSGQFTHLRHHDGLPGSLSDDRVRVILTTADGTMWVGTYEHGIDRYDAATGQFTNYSNDVDDPNSLSHSLVRDLFEDSNGTLWAGTDGGLSAWVAETQSFVSYVNDPGEPASLADNRVNTVFEDAGGILWIGTYDGLNKWNLATGAFEIYQRDRNTVNGLGSDVIAAFTEDADGNMWVGTYGGGLTRIDHATGQMTLFAHDPDDPDSLADNRVMALHSDTSGRLWIGTYERGLDRLDLATGRFSHFAHDPDELTSLSSNGVTTIIGDRFGSLWVGTYRGGLNRFNEETGRFARYRHDPANPTSLGSDSVLALHEDESGALWIGTDGAGLSRYDRRSGTFSQYRHDPGDPSSLSNDTPWAIYQDRRGGFWIGTQGGGLNYWDPLQRLEHEPKFRRYLRADGLPSSVVYGILQDDDHNLWLSTGRGLTRLNPSTGQVKNFDVTHGLQGRDFNFGAQYRSRDGRMYFGGSNGFNVFHPSRVRDNQHIPPVVLTEFLKFNEPVRLDRAAEMPIELRYDDSVIAFEFAALDFTSPERNRYRHKLEGFDADWTELGTLRRATYTNLRPGRYTLRVQASNNDGLWNEQGLTLGLVVGTPPWRSWWAMLLALMLAASMVVALVRRQKGKLARQAEYSRRLELDVQERTAQLAAQNRELAGLNEKLREVSVTDSLTGLWNRRHLANEIPKDLAVIRRARIESQKLANGGAEPNLLFLLMDLDTLKWVNDTYGHQAGDRAIVQMKEILVRVCRLSDTLIRWGGDEFLLLGRQTDRDAAAHLAERIRVAVADHRFDLGNGDVVRLSCSLGFTFFPFLPDSPTLFSWEQVLDLADRAMYRAKQAGRNQWAGVLGLEGNDPAIVMKRKDDDLGQLELDGIVELHSSACPPRDAEDPPVEAVAVEGPRLVS